MPIDKDTAHRILALMPGLWFILSADGRYLEVNREDHPYLVRPWAEIVGKHVRDVLPSVAAAAVLSNLARCPNPGDSVQVGVGMPLVAGSDADVEACLISLIRLDVERFFVLTHDASGCVDTLRRLAHSEARFQRALEGTSDGWWEWNVTTGEEFLSQRWKSLVGFEPGEQPTSFFECLHPNDVTSVRSALQAHFQLGVPFNLKVRLRTKSGGWRWFRTRGKVEIDGSGRPSRMAGAISDITVEHNTQKALLEMRQALQEQREAYAAVVNGATDAIISADADCRVRLFNPAAERIFGRSSASIIGCKLTEILPSADRVIHHFDLEKSAAARGDASPITAGTIRGVRADGSAIDLDATISRTVVAGQPVLTAIMRDITESLAARHREEHYQRDLADFARRLMVQEREASRRIALRLHDHLGQTLGTLRLNFDRLGVLSRSTSVEHREAQQEVRRLIDQAILEVRQTLVDLRPSLLDDEGLAAALDNDLALRMRLHPGVDAWVDATPHTQGQRWPAEVEYAAFMVAREAVHNALQHASPKLVRIALDGNSEHLLVDVHDDGIGMGMGTTVQKAEAGGHLGLIGMRERSLSVGAELVISPSPDGGTCVHFEWHRLRSLSQP